MIKASRRQKRGEKSAGGRLTSGLAPCLGGVTTTQATPVLLTRGYTPLAEAGKAALCVCGQTSQVNTANAWARRLMARSAQARTPGERALRTKGASTDGAGMRVSVVLPVLAETTEALALLLPLLPDSTHELVLVGEHSSGETVALAWELRPDVRFVRQAAHAQGN